jgi:hypothetical protein
LTKVSHWGTWRSIILAGWMTDKGQDARELVTPLVLIALALVLAILTARWIASFRTDFENLALGKPTKSVYGTYAGGNIFCASIAQLRECLEPARRRNLAKRVVWLGNSQLHAINRPRLSAKTAPIVLADALRPKLLEVQGFSMANASLVELMIAYSYLQKEHHIDVLLLPLFFDDMREQNVREALRPAVEQPDSKAFLQGYAAGRYAISALHKSAMADAPAETDSPSLQQRSEKALTDQLERCCGLETTRYAAHGQIEVQAFMFRNWVFGITPQTVRPIIPATYNQNMTALEDVLRIARSRSTRVILYIPPLRQDFKPPYDPGEYQRFKQQTSALAQRYSVRWIDLDRVVPGRLYGTKGATRTGGGAELDFMHFQETGHELLAHAMQPLVEDALK